MQPGGGRCVKKMRAAQSARQAGDQGGCADQEHKAALLNVRAGSVLVVTGLACV